MPASQAGRRGFESHRPLSELLCKSGTYTRWGICGPRRFCFGGRTGAADPLSGALRRAANTARCSSEGGARMASRSTGGRPFGSLGSELGACALGPSRRRRRTFAASRAVPAFPDPGRCAFGFPSLANPLICPSRNRPLSRFRPCLLRCAATHTNRGRPRASIRTLGSALHRCRQLSRLRD